jgi:hypothetical protein
MKLMVENTVDASKEKQCPSSRRCRAATRSWWAAWRIPWRRNITSMIELVADRVHDALPEAGDAPSRLLHRGREVTAREYCTSTACDRKS